MFELHDFFLTRLLAPQQLVASSYICIISYAPYRSVTCLKVAHHWMTWEILPTSHSKHCVWLLLNELLCERTPEQGEEQGAALRQAVPQRRISVHQFSQDANARLQKTIKALGRTATCRLGV